VIKHHANPTRLAHLALGQFKSAKTKDGSQLTFIDDRSVIMITVRWSLP